MFRLFFGRDDDEERLLRLEVEDEKLGRLSRELEARLECLDKPAGRGVLRGVRDFLRGVDGPEDVWRKSERTRLELKEVSWTSSKAKAIFWSYFPSQTTTRHAEE